jgi:ABC-type multidrug transport system fused ATPase/permease subunit
MRPVFEFAARLWREQPLRFTLVVLSAALASFLEGAWVAAIVPILQVLGGAGTGGTIGTAVATILHLLGLPLALVPALGLLLALMLAQQAATVLQQKITFGSIYQFEKGLRARLYEAIFRAAWPLFMKEKTSDLVNALILEATRASGAYYAMSQMLSIFLMLVAYGTLAMFISVPMTVLIVAAGTLFAFTLGKRVRRGSVIGMNVTKLNQEVQGEALESVSGAKLVKGVAAENAAIDRFGVTINGLAHEQYRLQMNQAWVRVIYDSLTAALVVASIYIESVVLHMTMPEIIVFLLIFARIAPRISSVTLQQHNVLAYLPAVACVDDLTAEGESMVEASGSVLLPPFSRAIEASGVCFGYDPAIPVVHDLDLTIESGKTTAVVGPSGAGKTTIVDLVMRLILPQSGEVVVDGVPIADLELYDWRRRIGYVAQDSVLFHSTIADNIRFGAPGATDEQIRAAAKAAYADEFIAALPEGYDTMVGDRGMRLSGGQRQRIALARALARQPEILILDEATSALDAESEERIQEAVARLAGRVTVLVITHRLATVRDADVIYVLEGGRVIEKGTYEELVLRGGRFEELRRLQALDATRADGECRTP